MAIKNSVSWFFVVLIAVMLSGCSQSEEPSPDQSTATTRSQAQRLTSTTRGPAPCEGVEALFCQDNWTIAYTTGLGQPLTSVWGQNDKVTVVGWQTPDDPYSSMIINYDGTEWVEDQSGPNATLHDVKGEGQEAEASSSIPSPPSDPDDESKMILVGTHGTYVVKNSEATGWEETVPPSSDIDLNAVWPFSDRRALVVGNGGAAYRIQSNGNATQRWKKLRPNLNTDLNGIWGTNGTSKLPNTSGAVALVVGDGGVIFEVRRQLRRLRAVDSGTTEDLNAIWGTNGTSKLPTTRRGRGRDGIWGTNGTSKRPRFRTFEGIWGTNGTSAVAVGANGTILALRPDGWTALDSGTTVELNAIWGTNGTSIVVGDKGTILITTDGETWREGPALTHANLTDVWGESVDHLFVTSDTGQLFEFKLSIPDE